MDGLNSTIITPRAGQGKTHEHNHPRHFLTSDHPEENARFYRDVAGLAIESLGDPAEYLYWKVDDQNIQLAIHDAAAFADYTSPPLPDSSLTHLW
ncbi:MAG: hypothetical protein KC435_08470 [Thermomicrobiales bacterium]|nr:hypothetical protein [Thermomicrobiales bacterium]